MALDNSHMFLSSIKDKNIVFEKIDYDIKGVPERLQYAQTLLDTYKDFLEQYFDKYFKVNPNKDQALSSENNVCNKIEQLGTYILSEVEDKNKLEYKFYNGQRNLDQALKRELSLDKLIDDMSSSVSNFTDGDVIHFLCRQQGNQAVDCATKVTKKDVERQDEVGRILREYQALKENLMDIKQRVLEQRYESCNEYTPNATKLKYMINAVNLDMLDTKVKIDRPITFKAPLSGSCVSCWDEVDFLNPVHVECFLKLTNSPTDFDSDLSMLLNYFNDLLAQVEKTLTPKELEVLKILRWGQRRVDKINETMKKGFELKQVDELYTIDADELSQIINKVVQGVMQEYTRDMTNFLNKRKNESILFDVVPSKVCKCCLERKTLSSFPRKSDMKDGYRNICRKCSTKGE